MRAANTLPSAAAAVRSFSSLSDTTYRRHASGSDASHATSAARYLAECLPRSEYWDIAAADQLEENTSARLLQFLEAAGAATA